MTEYIPEPDWKLSRKLREVALTRYYDRVVKEMRDVLSDTSRGSLERCEEVSRLTDESDKQFDICFSRNSRSWAKHDILNWVARGLLTEKEFSGFSDDTKGLVDVFLEDQYIWYPEESI